MAFEITQNNIGSQLLENLLGKTTGLSNIRVNLTGDGRAFGTFKDDPFGLKSGIALSTGQVVDLKGRNLLDGGFSSGGSGASTNVTFEKLTGVSGDPSSAFPTGVFRADLSNLGFDIGSVTIADSGSGIGGAAGRFSGFDLDAIKLSNTLIT